MKRLTPEQQEQQISDENAIERMDHQRESLRRRVEEQDFQQVAVRTFHEQETIADEHPSRNTIWDDPDD